MQEKQGGEVSDGGERRMAEGFGGTAGDVKLGSWMLPPGMQGGRLSRASACECTAYAGEDIASVCFKLAEVRADAAWTLGHCARSSRVSRSTDGEMSISKVVLWRGAAPEMSPQR